MKKTITYFKFLALSTLMLFMSVSAFAADYYWVGGSGSWSQFATHWATSSGGTSFHSQVPSANDNVYFDANSFSATGQTVNADNTVVYFKDMDWTGATYNPELLQTTASSSLNIFGSLKLIADMNFNVSGSLIFLSNTTGNTITTAGNDIKNDINFEGSGGGWTLADSLRVTGAASNGSNRGRINLTFGSFNTNGKNVYCRGVYAIGNSNTRSLTIDGSKITIEYLNSSVWETQSTANFTFSATNSEIIIKGYYGNFYANGKTFNKLSFESYAYLYGSNTTFNGTVSIGGQANIAGNNTFNDVVELNKSGTYTGVNYIQSNNTFNDSVYVNGDCNFTGNSTFNGVLLLYPGNTYTFNSYTTQTIGINGELNAIGTCTTPINLKSNTSGSVAYISKTNGNLNVDQVVMQDITATLSSTSYSANATNSFDAGNNTNWIFPAASGDDMYWIGGTGNWNDPAHWSFTSGGTAGSCIPGPGNKVLPFIRTESNVVIFNFSWFIFC